MTEELVREMRLAGCKDITFGVESGSQKILDYYRKGITVDDSIRAFELCHKHGIRPSAYIMVGAPVETVEDLELTVKLLKRIKPYSINLSVTTPAPGTELYNSTMSDGIYNISDYEETDYYQTLAPIKLNNLSVEELTYYQKKINRIRLKQTVINTLTSGEEFKRALKMLFFNTGRLRTILRSISRTSAGRAT